ncbi:MAG: low specificity L-threonine aldolase [Reinekea sp.]
MYFGSDNQAGASAQVFATLQQANEGITAAYGDDEWTTKAVGRLRELFECDAEVFLVSTGTAANSLALSCLVNPWESIVCHGQAHIINDELTAPEFFTGGARLIGLDLTKPMLSATSLTELLRQGAAHPPHNALPKALSITQITESGQVYSLEHISELTTLAQRHGLRVHMDGARFANAIAALGCTPAEMTWKSGVDVLSLGATKNGALCAEAVIFFDRGQASNFIAQRKRSGHLISKSRWLGAQFCGWLDNNHWLTLAQHANQMADHLQTALQQHSEYKLVWPVKANEVFVVMSQKNIDRLRSFGAIFYDWPNAFLPAGLALTEDHRVVRLVTSFRTTEDEVQQFISAL